MDQILLRLQSIKKWIDLFSLIEQDCVLSTQQIHAVWRNVHKQLSKHTDSSANMPEYTIPCQGIVAYSEHEWKWEDMLTREPMEDEFLVEMIATGVCHTDLSGYGGIYPRVLGHEGVFRDDSQTMLDYVTRCRSCCSTWEQEPGITV